MVRCLLALVVLAFAMPRAFASPQKVTLIDLQDVTGQVVEVLGSSVGRGWSPVRVSLRNGRSTEERTVVCVTGSSYRQSMARFDQRRRIKLAPGESRVVEMYIPCDRVLDATSSAFIDVAVDGVSRRVRLDTLDQARPLFGRTMALVRSEGSGGADIAMFRKALVDLAANNSSKVRGINVWMTAHSEFSPTFRALSSSGHSGPPGASLAQVAVKYIPERAVGWAG